MTKKERFNSILGWFAENQPVAQSELHFANPYQLLVAVILSAQCTDRRVNLVTPPLFERFPTPAENVIASIVYDKPVIAVDTHVFRVAHRLGLSNGSTPFAVEQDLERYIPVEQRAISHHWLILHGRYVCVARKPKCAECPLTAWCLSYPLLNKTV